MIEINLLPHEPPSIFDDEPPPSAAQAELAAIALRTRIAALEARLREEQKQWLRAVANGTLVSNTAALKLRREAFEKWRAAELKK